MSETEPMVLSLPPETHFDNVEAVRGALLEQIAAAPSDRIVIDLGQVENANSVTVALLVSLRRHILGAGRVLGLTNVGEELRNVIDFSGLSTVLLVESA